MSHQITDEQVREEALFAAHLTTQAGVDEPTALRDIQRRYGYDEGSARDVLASGRRLLRQLGTPGPMSAEDDPVIEFDPPHYTWQAANVREARSILRAAEDLLNSHMASLAPGDRTYVRREVEEEPSASIRVTLDLSGIVAQINAKAALRDGS